MWFHKCEHIIKCDPGEEGFANAFGVALKKGWVLNLPSTPDDA